MTVIQKKLPKIEKMVDAFGGAGASLIEEEIHLAKVHDNEKLALLRLIRNCKLQKKP